MTKIMATKEEMKLEFALFGDVWTLFKQYYHIPTSEQERKIYWESLMNDISDINHKYDSDLCRELLLAVLDELERKAGESQKKYQDI